MAKRLSNKLRSKSIPMQINKAIEAMFGDIENLLSNMMVDLYHSDDAKKYQFETFFMLFIKTSIVKAVLFKKNQLYKSAIVALDGLKSLMPELENSHKGDTIHYLMKAHLTYQSIYLHLNDYEKAISHCKDGLRIAIKEIEFRFQKKHMNSKNKAKIYKMKRMLETIVLLLYDMSFAYEGKASLYSNIDFNSNYRRSIIKWKPD